MSRIIGDCLVAGGVADEPERATAEAEECCPRRAFVGLPVEYLRAKVRGKLCDGRGDRVTAGDCKVQHA